MLSRHAQHFPDETCFAITKCHCSLLPVRCMMALNPMTTMIAIAITNQCNNRKSKKKKTNHFNSPKYNLVNISYLNLFAAPYDIFFVQRKYRNVRKWKLYFHQLSLCVKKNYLSMCSSVLLSLSCVCVFRTHAYTSIYFSHIPLRLSIRGRQCRSRLNVFPFYTAASLFSFRCFAHCIRITTSICFFFLFLIIHSRSPFVVVVSVVAVDSAAFLPIGQFMLFSFHRIPHTR